MLKDASWPRRVIAALRLERYGCDESLNRVASLLSDPSWQVRAFAVRGFARRGAPARESWFVKESEPRVLRAALRHRYAIDKARLWRGVRILAKSADLQERMLAAELGAASGDAELQKLAQQTAKEIILRMGRAEAGALSARLAALTGQHRLHRPFEWQNWLMKVGRSFQVQPAYAINEPGGRSESRSLPPPLLAQLEPEQFSGVEEYIAKLSEREVDLAICLDCTASMSGELAAAQGGIDDLMLFVSDMVDSLRVGLVAYRDRQDEFETKAWDFTSDIPTARQQLWLLSADGGGDHPEAVLPAMKAAAHQLAWRPGSVKVLVIVGDAPPHPGYGAHCIKLAERGRAEAKLTTHTIEAEGEPVKHFAEIAAAGGGRCVSLEDDDTLIAEITGLTLGDRYQEEFEELFRVYLELCR